METIITNLPKNRPYRSVITGGAGFLGAHLCERLIAEGHEVICIDNLLTGQTKNIKLLLDHPRFIFKLHDVTLPINLPQMILEGNKSFAEGMHLDYVLHLASPASPKDYALHSIHTLKVGAIGTYHALGLAKAYNSVFLLSSTSEVYGDPETNPQSENYWGHVNPIGPRSCYDEAKRFSEAITMAYHHQHDLDVRIARIFNTYGERMRLDDGRVVPNFIMQALENRPLTIYGDGHQTRCYCYVSDLINGLYRLLLSNETGPINIGNTEEISVLELAHRIIEQTQSNSPIHFKPLPADDPLQRHPDIKLAKIKLDWEPKVCLSEGLKRMIAFYQKS